MGHALQGKSGIPDFGGGEALASNVVGVVPKIAGKLLPTAGDSTGLPFHKVGQRVVAGVDGGLANVVGLFVLVTDMLVSQSKCFPTDGGRNPLLQVTHDGHRDSHQQGFGNDMVGWGEIGAMLGPIDLIKTLGEKLAADFA